MIFISKEEVEVLDAAAKYLRCMGYFYWSLGILNVCRMSTQGLGYSGRAVFSGVTVMFARCIVSLGFVQRFGYTAICFNRPIRMDYRMLLYHTNMFSVCQTDCEKGRGQ